MLKCFGLSEPLLDNSPLNEPISENEIALKKVPSMQVFLRNTSSIKKVPISKGNSIPHNESKLSHELKKTIFFKR